MLLPWNHPPPSQAPAHLGGRGRPTPRARPPRRHKASVRDDAGLHCCNAGERAGRDTSSATAGAACMSTRANPRPPARPPTCRVGGCGGSCCCLAMRVGKGIQQRTTTPNVLGALGAHHLRAGVGGSMGRSVGGGAQTHARCEQARSKGQVHCSPTNPHQAPTTPSVKRVSVRPSEILHSALLRIEKSEEGDEGFRVAFNRHKQPGTHPACASPPPHPLPRPASLTSPAPMGR